MLSKQGPVFVENKGQWDSRVRYLLQSGGLNTWITDDGVVYDQYELTPAKATEPQAMTRRGHVVSINFVGASSSPTARGNERQPGYHNYFIGNDPEKWATNVALYGRAQIEGVYPGIDAVFYLDAGKPRYDLVVSPGADPAQVSMHIEGATAIGVTPGGSLSIATSLGAIEQRELYAYQEIAGERKQVKCNFVVDGSREVRFDVGSYDRKRPLVIDPLVYSTYLGGSDYEFGQDIAVDGSGSAYVTGYTTSTNFPTPGAYQSTNRGGYDVFITKLNSSGGTLVYSTYLGGSAEDLGFGIAVDGNGNAYVTGYTFSTNFPTSGAFQSSKRGTYDAFVTKLNSGGSTLAYSTYLGGTNIDVGNGIAVDGSGNAYVTGYTSSTNLATSGAFQIANQGNNDVFVTKVNSVGSTLAYFTYLGGSSEEYGHGIAVDGSGNAYVTGYTLSTNFPTSGAYQSSNGGNADAFVTKLNSGGSTVAYSTYLGGIGLDIGWAIAVDGNSNAYITGYTLSTNFPTSGAYQSSYGGNADAFVTKLNSIGSTTGYSTYLGGSSQDGGLAIAVDMGGAAYVTGWTTSTNFPTSGAFQPFYGGSSDAFVTKLNNSGSTIAYSTFLGGNNFDFGYGIAVDGSGNAYVTGYTWSTNFPTSGAYQSSHGGGIYDAFVTKLSGGSLPGTAPNGGEIWCAGSMQSITWTSSGITNVVIELSSDGGSTFPTTIVVSTSAATGSYSWSIPSNQATGSTYRVRVSDALNGSLNAVSAGSFTISGAPSVTSHPQSNDAVCNGVSVTFTSAGTGIPTPQMQWYESTDGGTSWSAISGVTSESLTINSPTISMNGYKYHVVYYNNCGEATSATATLHVEDNVPPEITSPNDATVQYPASTGVSSTGTATATDNCSGNVTIDHNDEVADGECSHEQVITRTWSAEDANGNISTAVQIITVEDTQPPTMSLAANAVLWPPNHKYVHFTLANIITSASDPGAGGISTDDAVISSVSSDEPENSNGSGNTLNDIVIASDCRSVDLRAEREGGGNGRVYSISVNLTDECSNYSIAAYLVSVPHSQNGTAAVAGIPVYTETCDAGSAKLATATTAAITLRNYPNPFEGTTLIEYFVPEPAWVSLIVCDFVGSNLSTIVDAPAIGGMHEVMFDGSGLPSGTYMYMLRSNGITLSRMMVLIR